MDTFITIVSVISSLNDHILTKAGNIFIKYWHVHAEPAHCFMIYNACWTLSCGSVGLTFTSLTKYMNVSGLWTERKHWVLPMQCDRNKTRRLTWFERISIAVFRRNQRVNYKWLFLLVHNWNVCNLNIWDIKLSTCISGSAPVKASGLESIITFHLASFRLKSSM